MIILFLLPRKVYFSLFWRKH